MKTPGKLMLTIVLLIFGAKSSAQVGINTTSPNAQLDVRSSNQAAPSNTDGMLVPKVDAFPAANPTAAQQGMLVYLTTTSGSNAPGFYYWDNTSASWVGIGGKKGWDVVGNTGTNPATNFIGTTDNQDLVVRTNNAEAGRFKSNGFLGIGNSNPQNRLHVMGSSTGMTPIGFSVAAFESNPSAYVSILSNAETGVVFGANSDPVNGAIVYNNPLLPNGMSFRTNGNLTRMNLASNGNLALGSFVPDYPLHFQGTLGDKISLWGGLGAHYGFGIQNNLMQVHTNGPGADIALGYGSSATFTENVRIKGSGNVGIGTSNPLSKLHVWKGNSGIAPNPSAAAVIEGTGFTYVNVLSNSETGVVFGSSGFGTNGGIVYNSGLYSNGMNFRTGGNINRMNISSAGNVSIGDVVADAKLHIMPSSAVAPTNTDGLIIPRVSTLTAAASMTSAQNGMMVYLTGFFAGKLPGFYYWDHPSTSWQGVGSGANWSLTGNVNTDSSQHFIGTIDNQDLIFKRFNQKAGRIGLTNTAFGNESSNANVSGLDNVSVGASSLTSNVSGSYNVAVGTNALLSNLASEIVGIGENALASNTTGLYNTGVGTNAARTNGTGICVTAMGYNSLYNNTGSYNTAYGVNALLSNQTGQWNTAFGVDALRSGTVGHHNTAFGDRAMIDTTDGEQNTAVGHNALSANKTGDYNVTVGMNSIANNQAGINNTALGTGAMYWHTSGDNNTALGMEAMNNQTGGSNNIAIGKGANLPSLTGSNQLSIGNAIYGTGMNAAVSAKIGIGTASPQSKLHAYNGASGMTPNASAVGTFESSGSAYLDIMSPGESGILFGANGNSTNGAIVYNNPGFPNGMIFRTNNNTTRMSISSAGNIAVGGFIPTYPFEFDNFHGDKICLFGTGNHYGFGIQPSLLQIHSDIVSSDIAFGYGDSANFTETVRIKGNGRLGIGTSAPDARLEVKASNAATPSNTDGILIPRVNAFPVANPTAAQNGMMIYLTVAAGAYQTGFYYWDNPTVSWRAVGSKNNWSTTGNAGTTPATNFVGTSDNADLSIRTNATERVRITSGGSVGIKTTAPTTDLEVNGYTKLGSSAPAVKLLKLTGTTASTMGGSVSIAHGVTTSKILEISVMVEYLANSYVPIGYTSGSGYEFSYYVNGGSIFIVNKAGNSTNILSKPFKILVTYEE